MLEQPILAGSQGSQERRFARVEIVRLGLQDLIDRSPAIFRDDATIDEFAGRGIEIAMADCVGSIVNQGAHGVPARTVIIAEGRHRRWPRPRPQGTLVIRIVFIPV